MQGPYTQNQTVSTKREFLLYLVHPTTKDPATTEGGQQPQIRKPGEITWTNTAELLVHTGNGHYVLTLASTELDTLGIFSIRYARATFAFEFQDGGMVNTLADTNNETLKQMLLKMQQQLNWITHVIQQDQATALAETELNIL